MKIYASDNSELMAIQKIYRKDGNLIAEGNIMGSMPIRAVIKPAELRAALGMMDAKTMAFVASMLVRDSH